MDKEIKKKDSVKEIQTGNYGIIIDIQYVHNHYQLLGVSGWRHGIDNLEKQNYESLHTAIEHHKAIADLAVKALTEIAEYTNPTGEDGREMIIVAEGALIDIQHLSGDET